MAGLALTWFLTCPRSAHADEPVRIIFDTDITGDVDDVLALAMLHTLADRRECELLAVTISKINPLTAPFVDAVNTFYGRPDIPIGVPQEAQRRDSKYLKLIEARDDGQLRYPHDLTSNEDAPDAVDLIRKTLAAQPDHSVVLVQVGIAPNLARLIATKGDRWSELDGPALIRKKVKLLSVMAGAFEPIRGNDRYLEANVINGIPAMQKLAADWPDEIPVIWSGFEVGIAVAYPRISVHRDFDYVPHHIVKESYLLHSGPNHDRPTWDLTSVLYAVHPDRGYFDLSEPGNVAVDDDGFLHFTPSGNGRDRYLVMSDAQKVRVREALTMLVSQPPKGRNTK
ncbi:MAG: nucleoside hydrolase [Maioricimonas sp. JB049]